MNQWTMRDYLRVVFRQKNIIITSCVIVMLVVFVGFAFQTPEYEADVKMLVSGEKAIEAPYYKQLFENQNNPASSTQIEIVTSNPVLERAVNVLKLYERPVNYELKFASPMKKFLIELKTQRFTREAKKLTPEQQELFKFRQAVEDLRGHITVEPIKDTNIFIIHVRYFEPEEAAVLANVISRSYVIFDLEQQLAELSLKYGPKHPMVLQLQDNVNVMTTHLSGKILTNTDSIGPASVKIIQQASMPLRPNSKHKMLVLILALVTSIFFGVILAFIFEYMDQTVKSPKEAESILQLPLIGGIAKARRKKNMLIRAHKPSSLYVKGFVNLADQISLLQSDKSFKTLLLASCDHHDGNSNTCANLGLALSEYSGKNVLLIDANFRSPSIQSIFNIEEQEGLAEILLGQRKVTEVRHEIQKGLTVITAGQTTLNPPQLLSSAAMQRLLEEAKSQYDLIIIDAPEVTNYREGFILSSMVDKTLFVVVEGQTRRQVAVRMHDLLREAKAKLLGMVINRRVYFIPNWLYHGV